ncbi:MAG: Minf_1886 family protein [Planctomycetota bacterium]
MEDKPNELDVVLKKDIRYAREAYVFIFEALEYTIKRIGQRRHVTGQELLEGIRDYALEQFGPMGKTVFNAWGVRRSEDFGEIVFNLVANGLLGKTEKDSREDFKNGFDFDKTFNTVKI